MGKLTINAIQIYMNTDKGIFGQQLVFRSGINIIRAENTSGKSSLINSILYSLGFERLLSNRTGPAALKPVLKRAGTYKNMQFNVLESYVLLEIRNEKGKEITIRRQINGEEDSNLVRVYQKWIITQSSSDISHEYYYLNVEGSAQREKGFHKYLQEYLNLDLPFVPKFQGNDVPLYLECIFPVMFIEQVRGWTGIQATTPKIFGIQNVNKTVLEYLLMLDVQENIKRKEELAKENDAIANSWKEINRAIYQIANSIGAIAKGLIDKPQVELKNEERPVLFITKNNQEYTIEDYTVKLREYLASLSTEHKIIDNDSRYDDIVAEIEKLEAIVIVINGQIREYNNRIAKCEYEYIESTKRIEKIKKEVNKHKDLLRILNLGGDVSNDLMNHVCPICKQNVSESLVPEIKNPMTIEENMLFLNQQKEGLLKLIEQDLRTIDEDKIKKAALKKEIDEVQKKIIVLKSDVYRTDGLSESVIREKYITEKNIEEVEDIQTQIEEKYEALLVIAARYRQYKLDLSKMPDSMFSDDDTLKLNTLKVVFEKLLHQYDYKSTGTSAIDISRDNYLPVSCQEGFELSLDSSASDSIRIIWAYTVALASLSNKFKTNHFGIIIFDEPEQQRMKEYSSKELYKSIFENIPKNDQCIITTSESKVELISKISTIKTNYIELDDIVFRPYSDWQK